MPSIANAIASHKIPASDFAMQKQPDILSKGPVPDPVEYAPARPEQPNDEIGLGLFLDAAGTAHKLVAPGHPRSFDVPGAIPAAPLSHKDAWAAVKSLTASAEEGAWMVLASGEGYKLAPAKLAGTWEFVPDMTAMGGPGHWAWKSQQLKLTNSEQIAKLYSDGALVALVDGEVVEHALCK